MSKVLSDDKRDPHRFDPSPRQLSAWAERRWRTRSEAEREPCTSMDKAELEIERLSSVVVGLESMLHEISASLTEGPDIGPELPIAVKDELGRANDRAEGAEIRVIELECITAGWDVATYVSAGVETYAVVRNGKRWAEFYERIDAERFVMHKAQLDRATSERNEAYHERGKANMTIATLERKLGDATKPRPMSELSSSCMKAQLVFEGFRTRSPQPSGLVLEDWVTLGAPLGWLPASSTAQATGPQKDKP